MIPFFEFLPYVAQRSLNSNGSFKINPFSDGQVFKTVNKDANGLLMYPGNSWVGSGRGVTQEYLVYTAIDKVIRWNITSDLLAGNDAK